MNRSEKQRRQTDVFLLINIKRPRQREVKPCSISFKITSYFPGNVIRVFVDDTNSSLLLTVLNEASFC